MVVVVVVMLAAAVAGGCAHQRSCVWHVKAGKTLLVPTPRQRTGILSQIQLPEDCDEDTLSKYSTRQVGNGAVLSLI